MDKLKQDKLNHIMSSLFDNKKLEVQDPKGNWLKIHNPFDFTIEWFINNINLFKNH